jgi:hypothetical protein
MADLQKLLKLILFTDKKSLSFKSIEIEKGTDKMRFSILENEKTVASLSISKKELFSLAEGLNKFLGEDLIKIR